MNIHLKLKFLKVYNLGVGKSEKILSKNSKWKFLKKLCCPKKNKFGIKILKKLVCKIYRIQNKKFKQVVDSNIIRTII